MNDTNTERVVEAIDSLGLSTGHVALAIEKVADVIKPLHAAPGNDATGGVVNSLTEAVVGVTGGLCQIADAIHRLAEAVESK